MFRYRVFVCSGKKVTTVIVASDVALKWNQKTMLVAHNPPPPPIKSSCDAETQLWLFDVSGLLVVYVISPNENTVSLYMSSELWKWELWQAQYCVLH